MQHSDVIHSNRGIPKIMESSLSQSSPLLKVSSSQIVGLLSENHYLSWDVYSTSFAKGFWKLWGAALRQLTDWGYS